MWHYQFMQHAFEAGTIVAIIAGITGYFVVLRRSAFVAHAFSEIGFAGAAGAVLLGIAPIFGLLLGSTMGGLAISALGRRARNRDTQIGIVLAFSLGLGLLFISLYTGYATEAYSILFGEILGISSGSVLLTLSLVWLSFARSLSSTGRFSLHRLTKKLQRQRGCQWSSLALSSCSSSRSLSPSLFR